MTKEELEKKAENSYWDSEASGGLSSEKNYILGFIAGAKEMQEENEQLRQQIEKMRCCMVCSHYDFSTPNYCHKGIYRANQIVCDEWEQAE